jgi:hypothetical protein
MYGVLYAYVSDILEMSGSWNVTQILQTPEVFPAPHRGTGDALCAALNRIGGFIAPLIKIATTPLSGSTSTTSANRYVVEHVGLAAMLMMLVFCSPVFVSASLFMVAALLTMLLPIEVSLLITMICICLMSRLTDCRKDGFVNYVVAMRWVREKSFDYDAASYVLQ